MYFPTAHFLLSSLYLLTTLASPTHHIFQTLHPRTSPDRTCQHGTYESLSQCTLKCGSGASAGTCTQIAGQLVHDYPTYDCKCAGDPNDSSVVINDPGQRGGRSFMPTSKLGATKQRRSEGLATQEQRSLGQAGRGKQQLAIRERKLQTGMVRGRDAVTPCKRGYYRTMERCMANCGTRSGRCISVDAGSAVACQCKPGEL